jgi:transcriptional regulator with XRE-family HTH domain
MQPTTKVKPKYQVRQDRARADDLPGLLLGFRADRKLSQGAVAKAVRVSVRAISEFERGLRQLTRANRLNLVRFLRKHGYFARDEGAL